MKASKISYRFLSVFFVLSPFTSLAQHDEFIRGKLYDARTGEYVVFATVRLKNSAKGVISNMDGTFKVPLKFKSFGNELEISCLGYNSKDVLLSDFISGKIHTITLEPAVEQLNEVVVTKRRFRKNLTSAQIINKAISAIPKNYPYAPFSYVGYYRDYQLKNKEYYNLNEAIMEVYDRGFGTTEQTTSKVKIYYYKRNEDFQRDSVAEMPYSEGTFGKRIPGANLESYGGNEYMILRVHDAIRNHAINAYDFINRLDVDFKRNHSFELKPETVMGNDRLYVIAFFRNEGSFWAEGRIYISKSDFSIHKLDYALFRQEGSTPLKIYSSEDGGLKKIVDIKLEYRRHQDRMYLNYISVNNSFWVKAPPDFTIDSFYIDPEKKCYELNFTRSPEVKSAQKSNRYEIYYKGEKSNIDKIEVLNRKVLLFPDLEFGSAEYDLFSNTEESFALFSKSADASEWVSFDYKIRKLEDVNGQKYNESNTVEVNQFREFFVQEVKPNEEPTVGTSFMKKNIPIFKDQPIVRPDDFDEYWMNTPLKSSEN